MGEEREESGEAAVGPEADESGGLTPASQNPWYVLATIHGEHERLIDPALHSKNRCTWNRWMAPALSEKTKRDLIESGVESSELEQLSEDERTELHALAKIRRVELPEPGTPEKLVAIELRSMSMDGPLAMGGFVFPGDVFFERTRFHGALFEGARFCGKLSFWGSHFADLNTDFHRCWFVGAVDFWYVHFHGKAWFSECRFDDEARFRSNCFGNDVLFTGTQFAGLAQFDAARFLGDVSFQNARFGGVADFDGARFAGAADFTLRAFERAATFKNTHFAEPPNFRDRAFSHSTTWTGMICPRPPDDPEAAEDAGEQYAALRHAMDAAGRHDHAREFHARELACRRVYAPWPTKIAIGSYQLLSDVGRSVLRPVAAWTIALMLAFIVHYQTLTPDPTQVFLNISFEAFTLALGSAAVVGSPIFDPRKRTAVEVALAEAAAVDNQVLRPPLSETELCPAETCESICRIPIPRWLQLLELVHAVFSGLCLFLVGFAVRNWLRIR